MLRFLRRLLLASVFALLALVLVVAGLRWLAFGEAQREALALMDVAPSAVDGDSGVRWLAFDTQAIPEDALEAALAEDVAAFTAWQAGEGERLQPWLWSLESAELGQFASPLDGRYPERARVPKPELACRLGDAACFDRLREHLPELRAWLDAEAVRLAAADRALAAGHLRSPYPIGLDSPFPAYQRLFLPVYDVARQGLDGDVPGALGRACGLLSSARRFNRQSDQLVHQMVMARLVQESAGLVLSLRRADPAAALPSACDVALAPVQPAEFEVCDSLRGEYRLNAGLSRRLEAALANSWHPRALFSRALLVDGPLERAWLAEGFAPMCSEAGRAEVAAGRLPTPTRELPDFSHPHCYAAMLSCSLVQISRPAYRVYQQRLLDFAAALRLQQAAIAVADGRLDPSRLPEAGASPNYAVEVTATAWRVPQREGHEGRDYFEVPRSDVAAPAPTAPAAD